MEPKIIGSVEITPESAQEKHRNPYDQLDYDLVFNVQADITGRSYQLYMNVGEDAYVVSKRFLSQTGLQLHEQSDQIDQIQQIRDFVERNAP